jgi:hypothetical protein
MNMQTPILVKNPDTVPAHLIGGFILVVVVPPFD